MKRPINRRLEHIYLLEQSLIKRTDGVSQGEVKSVSRVIKILEFVSNTEYQNLYRGYKKSNKENVLVELTHLFLDDIRWFKISNRRREDYENIKRWYLQKENRDFKVEEYIYLLEQNNTSEKKNVSNEYLNYLNDKKSYNKEFS